MSLDPCAGFAATNPDNAGIGVRISFYLQTFLLVFLVDRSWVDAPIALWTFLATSFGLTVAAIIQEAQGQLTLYQGLQVSNLVWLANFGMFVAMASYSRQKAASHSNTVYDYNVKSGILLQTFLSICLTIYMWATIETFGSLPQCSHLVTFMVFVIKVPALQPGKIIGLTASSVLLVMYTSISLHELFASVRRRRVKALIPHHLRTSTPRHSTLPTVQTPTTPAAVPSASLRRPPSLANISVVPRTATQTSILSPTEIVSLSSASGPSQSVLKRRPRRTQWSREVDPMFIGVVICQVLVFTYFIVSSELLLTNNYGAQDAAQQMGFGQISALIVILPGALAVIGAVREHGFKRLSKRKRSNTRLRSRRNTNV